MPNTDMSRAADLYYAYQHGQDAAKGDLTADPQFKSIFGEDKEAHWEYDRGYTEHQARLPVVPATQH